MITVEHPEHYNISLTVNGETIARKIPSHLRLLEFLRVDLGLTGTKEVCSEGECGACTVIMNGKVVNSCLIFAVEAEGAIVTTIEGLSNDNSLTKLQQAFIEHHSVQCGYCIPGMVLMGEQILKEHSSLNRETIKNELAGNLCRCTGYHKIIDAIVAASDDRRKE
ncbi:MAG: (2Fe-2S)-binding protein [Fidelibacterota bacterium]